MRILPLAPGCPTRPSPAPRAARTSRGRPRASHHPEGAAGVQWMPGVLALAMTRGPAVVDEAPTTYQSKTPRSLGRPSEMARFELSINGDFELSSEAARRQNPACRISDRERRKPASSSRFTARAAPGGSPRVDGFRRARFVVWDNGSHRHGPGHRGQPDDRITPAAGRLLP